MGEFQITHGNRRLIIYYCPHCGGSTPKSRRSSQFANITAEEQIRIARLFEGVRTVTDIVARFGQPDDRLEFGGVMTIDPPREGEPATYEKFGTMVYRNLCPVADVVFRIRAEDAVHGTWVHKYNGEKKP